MVSSSSSVSYSSSSSYDSANPYDRAYKGRGAGVLGDIVKSGGYGGINNYSRGVSGGVLKAYGDFANQGGYGARNIHGSGYGYGNNYSSSLTSDYDGFKGYNYSQPSYDYNAPSALSTDYGYGVGAIGKKSFSFNKPELPSMQRNFGGMMGGLGGGRIGSGIGGFRNRLGRSTEKSRKLPGAPAFNGLDGHMGGGFAPSRPGAPSFGGFGGFMGNDFAPGGADDW